MTAEPTPVAVGMLFAALVGSYVAARSTGDALRGRFASLAFAVPLAGIVTVAALRGEVSVALGAALSSAVAALGLAGGMALLQRRPDTLAPQDAGSWSLLVPGALAVFLVGLSGNIGLVRAAALLALAAFVVPALKVPRGEPAAISPTPPSPSPPEPDAAPSTDKPPPPDDLTVPLADAPAPVSPPPPSPALDYARTPVPRGDPKRALQFLLACGVALLAGWAACEGAGVLAARNTQASAGLLAACVLGPLALLPLLGYSSAEAAEGRTYRALGLCVRHAAIAALILPALAAILVLLTRFARTPALDYPTFGRFTLPVRLPAFDAIAFPVSLWRVECVLLIALSALLLPISTARQTPRKRDGALLLGVYVLYLLLSSLSAIRPF